MTIPDKRKARKSREWKEAFNIYRHQLEHHNFSMFGEHAVPDLPAGTGPMLPFADVLAVCPWFYPAQFHRAELMLRFGADGGEREFEQAFRMMREILEKESELEQEISMRLSHLEELLRYDLAAKYAEEAIRVLPDSPAFYDDRAFYMYHLPNGDKGKAKQLILQALDMEPDNEYFIANYGWMLMLEGRLDEAKEQFDKAIAFDGDLDSAWRNMDIVDYMQENGIKNYYDYLLRPVDREQLQAFMDEADFDGVADMCSGYNTDRIEAFKLHHLQSTELPPHDTLDAIELLTPFMEAIVNTIETDFVLFENTKLLFERPGLIYYNYFNAMGNVDAPLLQSLNHALTEIYTFLSTKNLIPKSELPSLLDHLKAQTTHHADLIGRYYETLHSPDLHEDQKESNIALLFNIKPEEL